MYLNSNKNLSTFRALFYKVKKLELCINIRLKTNDKLTFQFDLQIISNFYLNLLSWIKLRNLSVTVYTSTSCAHFIHQISRENCLKRKILRSILVSKAIEGFLEPLYNR